jgi:hypothetical protein
MRQIFCETNRFSARREIPLILWNAYVHYRIHTIPPPTLSWGGSIHSMPPFHFLKTHFSTVSNLCLVSPRASSPKPCTYRRTRSSRRPLWIARRNTASFYGEELLAPGPTTKLADHPLSAVRDCYSIYLHRIFGRCVVWVTDRVVKL